VQGAQETNAAEALRYLLRDSAWGWVVDDNGTPGRGCACRFMADTSIGARGVSDRARTRDSTPPTDTVDRLVTIPATTVAGVAAIAAYVGDLIMDDFTFVDHGDASAYDATARLLIAIVAARTRVTLRA
jgi:hypothetical protein